MQCIHLGWCLHGNDGVFQRLVIVPGGGRTGHLGVGPGSAAAEERRPGRLGFLHYRYNLFAYLHNYLSSNSSVQFIIFIQPNMYMYLCILSSCM